MRRSHSLSTVLARAALALGVIIAGFGLAAMLLEGRAAAQPPDPNPGSTQPVREQNLDAGGLIRMHEQGIADVNVTNTPLDVQGSVDVANFPGSLEISNFPAVQDVEVVGGELISALMPVTTVRGLFFNTDPDEEEIQTFPTVYATSIVIAKSDVEALIQFRTPLAGTPRLTALMDSDGDADWFQLTFVHPVPINEASVFCWNESDRCHVTFQLFGF